ncbi:MAG: MFS transporter [Dehalococcoidia bacterium]
MGVAGLVLAATAVVGLAGNPVGGWLTDRIGARHALMVGLVLAAGGSAALVLVDSAWSGFMAAGLYGMGMSVSWPAEDALLATSIDAHQRPQAFAVRHATLNIGFSVGALLAAVVVAAVASPTSFVLLYLFDAVSFLVFAGVLTRIPDALESQSPPEPAEREVVGGRGGYREVLHDRVFCRVWLIVLVLVVAGYAQYHAAFPLFATGVGGLSASGLGLAFAANTITVVVAQLLVLRMMVGRRRTRGSCCLRPSSPRPG